MIDMRFWHLYVEHDYDYDEDNYTVETKGEKHTFSDRQEAFSFYEQKLKNQQTQHRAYIDGLERDIKKTKLRFFDA